MIKPPRKVRRVEAKPVGKNGVKWQRYYALRRLGEGHECFLLDLDDVSKGDRLATDKLLATQHTKVKSRDDQLYDFVEVSYLAVVSLPACPYDWCSANAVLSSCGRYLMSAELDEADNYIVYELLPVAKLEEVDGFVIGRQYRTVNGSEITAVMTDSDFYNWIGVYPDGKLLRFNREGMNNLSAMSGSQYDRRRFEEHDDVITGVTGYVLKS